MSSQKKSSRLEGKDLITIGIYTVIYVVIVMLVAMLGFIPIFIRSEEHTSELQSRE